MINRDTCDFIEENFERNTVSYKEFDGNSLQDLIWNWINGSGTTKYINND